MTLQELRGGGDIVQMNYRVYNTYRSLSENLCVWIKIELMETTYTVRLTFLDI